MFLEPTSFDQGAYTENDACLPIQSSQTLATPDLAKLTGIEEGSGPGVGAAQEQNSSTSRRSPTALILEPTRDLAEQTAKVVEHLQSNLTQPSLRSTLLVGGENPKPQAAAIAGGIDIVTGTPGIKPFPQYQLLTCMVFRTWQL